MRLRSDVIGPMEILSCKSAAVQPTGIRQITDFFADIVGDVESFGFGRCVKAAGGPGPWPTVPPVNFES